jgi:hypothetical protein
VDEVPQDGTTSRRAQLAGKPVRNTEVAHPPTIPGPGQLRSSPIGARPTDALVLELARTAPGSASRMPGKADA